MDPAIRGGDGVKRARELLDSGEARRKMDQIAEAQGGLAAGGPTGGSRHEVAAVRDGWVESIDCFRVARITRLAGAPTDPGAGIEMLKRKGDPVRTGEPLFRVHGVDRSDFGLSVETAAEDPRLRIA